MTRTLAIVLLVLLILLLVIPLGMGMAMGACPECHATSPLGALTLCVAILVTLAFSALVVCEGIFARLRTARSVLLLHALERPPRPL